MLGTLILIILKLFILKIIIFKIYNTIFVFFEMVFFKNKNKKRKIKLSL